MIAVRPPQGSAVSHKTTDGGSVRDEQLRAVLPGRYPGRGGSDQATVRSLNRGVVLDVIKRDGPISRATVAKLTKLTKPTVSAIVDELASDGMLTEIGVGQASPSG